MRILLKQNVWDAALDRIRRLFDEFEIVAASMSGGKDSTVVYHLARLVATEKDRWPLPVIFFDQEAEWSYTVEYIRGVMHEPGVQPLWFQIPIYLDNGTSFEAPKTICWDPAKPDDWLRPKEPDSIHDNRIRHQNWGNNNELFEAILNSTWPGRSVACLTGMRADENVGRMLGLNSVCYQDITWGKRMGTKAHEQHFNFHPIYDWSYTDVWKAINDNGWPYNRIYDYQWKAGVTLNNMRVSNLHHEQAVKALFYLQEADPELYDKLTKRLHGVDMAGKLGWADYYVKHLPPMFASWREYRDHLVDKLIQDDRWRRDMVADAAKHDKLFEAHPNLQERYARDMCQAVLSGDSSGKRLASSRAKYVKPWAREMEAEDLDKLPWHEAVTWRDKAPHEYILRREAPEVFEKIHKRILRWGRDEEFCMFGRFIANRRYFYFKGYKYWVMRPNGGPGNCLNRCRWDDLDVRPGARRKADA